MRAVIDTNVFISGLISKKSFPALVLDAWILNKFQPVISQQILEEYGAVILRKKFNVLGNKEKRMEIIKKLISLSWVSIVYPKQKIYIISDPKDNIFLECAVESKAKFIVSGDNHLLELKEYRDIKIVTAKTFITEVIKMKN
jgi:hypothetical protein